MPSNNILQKMKARCKKNVETNVTDDGRRRCALRHYQKMCCARLNLLIEQNHHTIISVYPNWNILPSNNISQKMKARCKNIALGRKTLTRAEMYMYYVIIKNESCTLEFADWEKTLQVMIKMLGRYRPFKVRQCLSSKDVMS